MTRLLPSLVLLIVVILCLPTLLPAQELRNLELNPFFGLAGHTESNYEIGTPQAVPPVRGHLKLNHATMAGVRFNVNTTGSWGEEFFMSAEPTQARFIPRAVPALEQSYHIRIWNFGGNVMYYLVEDENHATRPFLTAGLGAILYHPKALDRQVALDPLRGNLPGFTSSAQFAFNYGIGFKQRIADGIAFRVDVRGVVSKNPTFGLARTSPDPNAPVLPAFGAMNDVQVSGGLVFKFKR